MAEEQDGQDFNAEEAVRAQRALRASLGLGAERFPLPAFVGMISDEIEQLRAAGRTDVDIAEIITTALGRPFSPADLVRHYAPPEARRGRA